MLSETIRTFGTEELIGRGPPLQNFEQLHGGLGFDSTSPMAALGVFNSALHRKLLDLLPAPVFVRSAHGEILYANRSGSLAVGEVPGIMPAPWQVTPQVATTPHPSRASRATPAANGATGNNDAEGELDLPRDLLPVSSTVELPPSSGSYYVLLQGRGASIRTVLTMHRVPFWMSAPNAAGMKRGVVMYVAPVTGGHPQLFFPAGVPPGGLKATQAAQQPAALRRR